MRPRNARDACDVREATASTCEASSLLCFAASSDRILSLGLGAGTALTVSRDVAFEGTQHE